MNTWVLCLRRRNALVWTIRSRSRWKAVRRSWGGSSRSRPLDSPLRVARSESVLRSTSSSCSRTVPTAPRVARASDATSDLRRWLPLPADYPVVQVGEDLAAVAGQASGLAARRRVPGGRYIALDPQVPGHPPDPEVVPGVRH